MCELQYVALATIWNSGLKRRAQLAGDMIRDRPGMNGTEIRGKKKGLQG